MERVFHFSDFHITPDFGEPENNLKFLTLLNSLTGYNDSQNYIVYTGDVIDAVYVARFPEPSDKQAAIEHSYALAKKYFQNLMLRLGVSEDRIIFCCGNHDVKRDDIAGERSLCDPGINFDETKFAEGYLNFCKFHMSLTKRPFEYGANLYQINGFNFFAANSTWKAKQGNEFKKDSASKHQMQYPRCVGCKNLLTKIEEIKSDIVEGFASGHNIFLIHDPFTEWCENNLFDYNVHTTVLKEVTSIFNKCLCGDKHTDTEIGPFFVVGTKFSQDKFSYGILSYSTAGSAYKTVIVDTQAGNSMKKPEKETYETLIGISQEYIKPKAISLLTGNVDYHDISLGTVKECVKEIYKQSQVSDSNWTKISELYKLVSSYEETQKKKSGKSKFITGNIFSEISKDIVSLEGENKKIAIRSRPSRGKSIFLSLEYLYLLSQYNSGNLDYMPVYLNTENYSDFSSEDIKVKIDSFFMATKKISDIEQKPVFYIIDGLCAYNYYNDSIDDYISTKVMDINASDIIVFAFDLDDIKVLPETALSSAKDSARVMYISGISPREKPETLRRFIKLFCLLHEECDENYILTNIDLLNISEIDMNIIIHFSKLFSEENIDSIVQLYTKFARGVIKKDDFENSKAAAFRIHILGEKYDSAKLAVSKKTYEVLRKQKELSLFLIATHYYAQLNNFNGKRVRADDKGNILNHFFDEKQNIFLNALFEQNQDYSFIRVLKDQFNNLSYAGRSQLIYLIGKHKPEWSNFVKLKRVSTKLSGEKLFYYKVAERSRVIFDARKNHELMMSYIESLVCSEEDRRINRCVNMLYYGDITSNEALSMFEQKVAVFQGFDIFHTYHVLTKRIDKAIESLGTLASYSLNGESMLFLDMFTLCDLLEQRIRTEKALTRNCNQVEIVDSYFYTDRYRASAYVPTVSVLEKAHSLIKRFNTINETVTIKKSVREYYKQCELDLMKCIDLFKVSPTSHLNVEDFSAEKKLKKISEVATIARTGWKIANVPTQGKTFAQIQTELESVESQESVLEHIFQTYLIGLLFLPETKEMSAIERDYNKQKILNIVLLHDLGECCTGDCPPCASDYLRIKKDENSFVRSLLIEGAFGQMADLTDYLDLWNEWKNRTGINVEIAKDLDKIQMVYKYYVLVSEKKLANFETARRNEIEHLCKELKTAEGRRILLKLISEYQK